MRISDIINIRPMRGRIFLKPQDVVLLLKVYLSEGKLWTLQKMASDLFMSISEISYGLERLRLAGLIDFTKRKVFKRSALEFLLYGFKYVFPALPGPLLRGIPTAHSAPPISKMILSTDQMKYIWPISEGKIYGQSVAPLYKSAPLAALKDGLLYKALAVLDSLRVGRGREIVMAQEYLRKLFEERLIP